VIEHLPAVNATLNGIAAVLLAIGYTFMRQGRIQAHKRTMLSAFSVSVVFLACYLTYHFNAGIVYYQKTGISSLSLSHHPDHAYDSGGHHSGASRSSRCGEACAWTSNGIAPSPAGRFRFGCM